MKNMYRIHNIKVADFKERTRRYSFLVLLSVIILLSFFAIPSLNNNRKALRIIFKGGYRPIYNSTLIGNAIVLFMMIVLSLFGFYFVSGSIKRDDETGVGQIIATTSTNKITYLFGKLFSNFAVLSVMIGLIFLVAIILNIIRGEAPIDIWQLAAPFLIVALPSVFFISSLAVLFDSIPILRSAVGNIIYFFVWIVFLILDSSDVCSFDVYGIGLITKTLRNLCNGKEIHWWTYTNKLPLKTVPCPKANWNVNILKSRIVCILIPILIILITSIFFNYFDTSKEKLKLNKNKKKNKKEDYKTKDLLEKVNVTPNFIDIKKLTIVPIKFKIFSLAKAELRLMLKEVAWWWMTIIIGLNIACIFAPIQVSQHYLFPLTWLFPISIWSSMGTREKQFNTKQLIFSCENYIQRKIPSMFIAGTVISIFTGGGMLLKLIIMGNFKGVLLFVISSITIPALAIVLGVLGENNKFFQVLYIII